MTTLSLFQTFYSVLLFVFFCFVFFVSIGTDQGSEVTEILYDKVYDNFVEEIDGIDNGIESVEGTRR